MGRRRRSAPYVKDLIGAGVARRHREHDQSAWNRRWAANRHIEVPAPHSNGEADDKTDREFHALSPNTRQTLTWHRVRRYHVFA